MCIRPIDNGSWAGKVLGMKRPYLTLLAGASLCLTLAASAGAQTPSPVESPSKPAAVAGPSAAPSATPDPDKTASNKPIKKAILDKYDTNKDGKIDGEEKVALKRDRMINRADRMKKYDKDGDGSLSETERAAMKADRKVQSGDANKSSPRP